MSSPVRQFFGVLLMIVGVLIAGLSGLCTLAFSGISISESIRTGRWDQASSLLPVALMFGAPFVALGLGLFFGGRAIARGPKRPL